MSLAVVLVAALFGSLIGSFANVVIGRLPEGRSIVHPGSSCPSCGRRLGPAELVPILSWALQGARCRGCGARISARYPLVEALVATGFAALAWRWSPLDEPVAFLALATWWTLLVVATFIDLDTFEIPDVVTLPGATAMLVAAAVWGDVAGLPDLSGAATGAAIGAGLLTLINRLGALVLRRFRDTRERLWPIGFDQANLAALTGALGGFVVGAAAAAASLGANLATRRTLRLPEGIVWLAWLAAIALAPVTIGLPAAIGGSLAAAGLAAWVGAWTWWIHDLRTPAHGAEAATDAPPDGSDEPVAMGFGDVKLAALLGAVLGWERLLVALFAAVLVGAVVGLIQRAAGGTRVVPFGPFLALGGVLALFFGDALLRAYLGALGVA
jgi:leader peptidase (prepilin peptidase)/N-methyltransferase